MGLRVGPAAAIVPLPPPQDAPIRLLCTRSSRVPAVRKRLHRHAGSPFLPASPLYRKHVSARPSAGLLGPTALHPSAPRSTGSSALGPQLHSGCLGPRHSAPRSTVFSSLRAVTYFSARLPKMTAPGGGQCPDVARSGALRRLSALGDRSLDCLCEPVGAQVAPALRRRATMDLRLLDGNLVRDVRRSVRLWWG